jgi:hypothetical protein
MSRWSLRVGVPLLAALGLVACGSDSEPTSVEPGGQSPVEVTSAAASPTPEGDPMTVEAAQAAAEHELDAYAAGDWAGAWDLWTAAGQAAISREEYVRLHTECGTLTGIMFEITNARLEGDDQAVVTWERLIATGAAIMIYEDGVWRYQPEDDDMADYAKGVDQILEERRADGSCEG